MKKLLTLFLLLAPIVLQAESLKITSSKVGFKIKNAGLTVNGSFGDLSGSIDFSPENYLKSKMDVSLQANSINTGIAARDNHLRKAEYFDVATYPEIKMKSRFFGTNKDGSFTGYFTLTLKGKTGQITVPFTYQMKDGKHLFKGSFTLNRRDYNVGGGSLIMGDEVTVDIEVNCVSASSHTGNALSLPSEELPPFPHPGLQAILQQGYENRIPN